MRADNSLTAYRMQLVTGALANGPLCLHDLAPKVFLCYEHARRLIKFMCDEGLVHISKWPLRCTPRNTRVAAYALGRGKDAPKPAAVTIQKRQARYKSKLRADAERLDVFLSKTRARKRKPSRDPMVAAMFGAATAHATTEGASHV